MGRRLVSEDNRAAAEILQLKAALAKATTTEAGAMDQQADKTNAALAQATWSNKVPPYTRLAPLIVWSFVCLFVACVVGLFECSILCVSRHSFAITNAGARQ